MSSDVLMMTRRTWFVGVASAATVTVLGPPTVAGEPGPYPHPAIPSRVLDRQLDAALVDAIDEAPVDVRPAVAAAATRWFGGVAERGARTSVPRAMRTAVRRLVTRG